MIFTFLIHLCNLLCCVVLAGYTSSHQNLWLISFGIFPTKKHPYPLSAFFFVVVVVVCWEFFFYIILESIRPLPSHPSTTNISISDIHRFLFLCINKSEQQLKKMVYIIRYVYTMKEFMIILLYGNICSKNFNLQIIAEL